MMTGMASTVVVGGRIPIVHATYPHRPFHQATGRRPYRSVAYYAEKRVTLSDNITMVMYPPREATANPSGQKSSTHYYAPQMAEDSASITMCERALCQNANAPMSAPSAAQKITTLSLGHANLDHIPSNNLFISMTSPSLLNYRDFYDTIIHRPLLLTSTDSHNEIYNHIVQPYDPDAFENLMLHHELTYLYPLLVTNLRNGFPLGEMPSLTETVILENHPLAQEYPDTVKQYLEDEVECYDFKNRNVYSTSNFSEFSSISESRVLV